MSQSEIQEFVEPFYKVCVRGPAHTRSGYGEYVRSLLRILSQYVEYEITLQSTRWGQTPYIFDKAHPDMELLNELSIRTKAEYDAKIKYDVSYQVQLPNEWDPQLAKFNIGVTAATEVDRVTQQWQECCNQMDLVIAMSEHTKRSLLNGPIEITTPIIVLGSCYKECFTDDIYHPTDLGLDIDPKVKDLFLHVGQISDMDPMRDRKNTYGLIYAFKKAFAVDPTKGLILKVNMGRNHYLDFSQTSASINKFIEANGLQHSRANIYLLHGTMTDKQMASLYRHPKVKAFVSFTRGEGFGIPFLEAAVSGLPIIAANHSSYPEFLTVGSETCFCKVDHEMAPVHERFVDNNIIPQGAMWAEIHPDSMVKSLTRFAEKGTDVPRQKAGKAKSYVVSKYDKVNMAIEHQRSLRTLFPDKF
jgi:glycosyltransferase involved in cell wall biosynthesis